MGTRADFYIEEADKSLTWVASIAWDGYPNGIDKEVLKAKSKQEFIDALTAFFSDRDDVTLPENGWPWPWDNSNTTDYSYVFRQNKVRASCFGNRVFDPTKQDAEGDFKESNERFKFPDMSAVRNVRYDKGSGLIIISAR